MLSAHNRDLIALASDLGDPTGKRLSQLKEIFTDRLYVGLPGPHFPLAELAEKLALPVVAAPPVFYLRAEQAAEQRLVSAIRLVTTLKALPGSAAAPSGAYFLSSNEMMSRFRPYPQALDAIGELAERCRVDLPVGVPHFPEGASAARKDRSAAPAR